MLRPEEGGQFEILPFMKEVGHVPQLMVNRSLITDQSNSSPFQQSGSLAQQSFNTQNCLQPFPQLIRSSSNRVFKSHLTAKLSEQSSKIKQLATLGSHC